MLIMLAALLIDSTQATADVNTLKAEVSASALPANYKTLLNQVLNSAITRINQGIDAAAISLLQTFEAYVNRFVALGVLDAVTGQNWIDQANAIILEI